MKIIMENWRGYITESHSKDVFFETIRSLEKDNKLEESTFRNLVVGIGLGAAAMFWTAMNDKSNNVAQAVAQMQIKLCMTRLCLLL